MLDNIKDSKIIVCLLDDIATRWVHYLDPFKLLIEDNSNYIIYKSQECYFVYCRKDADFLLKHISYLVNNNYIHWVLTDFANVDKALYMIDHNVFNNFDYSILNHMGETIYEDSPRMLNKLINYKYYFSCSNILKSGIKNINTISEINNSDKMIMDYRYSLIYFYVKCGFNFFQRGQMNLSITDRKEGVFVYGKAVDRSWRMGYLKDIINTGKAHIKSFSDEDMFWSNQNNNLYHTPFVADYNEYQYNLIFETQPPFDSGNIHCDFITEKTLKSLMVSTPSYVLLQYNTYNKLTDFGFYFLNQEFGDYNLENYQKFCIFLKDNNNDLFLRAMLKSAKNKEKLEEYIYSYKQKEIKLLING
jgi:hypothetical protein